MKNKKILLGAVAVILAVILLITGICINVNKKNKGISISTQELARAMSYEQFKEGDEAVDGTENVEFSAFFLRDLDGDGYAEKIKGTCKEIGAEDTMYMEINVQTEGYLKDAKIEIAGENFYLQTALPKDEQLKDNYIGSNIKLIEFNELNNGTQKLITGVVRSGDYSYENTKNSAIGNNINNYSRTDNKIILTGTYVGEGGTETEIRKEIELIVDWYGKTKAEITSANQNYKDLPERIDEENGTIKLSFEVKTNETEGKLNLSKNYVEGTIPELNGYAATEVKMTNTTSENLTFVYDEDTKTFTIERTGVVSEDGTIETAVARNNTYNLEVTYPIKAYQSLGEDTVSIKIPVKTNCEGYNNQNTEFTNPYKSNTASTTIVVNYERPQGSVANFEIKVGKNIYNPTSRYIVSKEKPLKIYNGISEKETEDTYTVRWSAYTGTNGETTGLVMKETKDGEDQVKDKFIKTDATEESMENITRNIGIYITGADEILKEEGWIKVYDEETGNLLVTFTKEDWSKYTAENPYKYELPVKHIRIETSETNAEASLYVYNIKELDDEYITEKYTEEEFENLQYIKSTLSGYLGGNHIKTTTHQANYEAPYSVATIGISNNKISTQVTEENDKITITASNDTLSNQVGWVDGSFLVKLPEEILEVEINSVGINNSAVTITTYEVIENENGKFIKINTKNNNETEQGYIITIDTNITPDPRIETLTTDIELYATNSETVSYYYEGQDIYDVNDNLNTEEIVNKTTTSISLVSPGSLLTNQTASEYDGQNSVVVSPQIADIMPSYAKVDNEKQKAKIGIQLKNNYTSTISEVVILGKIPFEGNTTVLSEKDLGSQFTTKMIDTGIEVPEGLEGKVKVYYSENENPDKDLTKTENGWTLAENITNFDNIKTFLIDFEDEVIEQGVEYTFYYRVEIPEGLDFNKVSYSHHGVYFSLDTEEGKYRTQTEPNKLGLRIAEKFNLEIIKTQTGKEKRVLGATYSIKEILEDGTIGETKTGVTNENGTLTINNLYAEKTYEIQEIKTPNDYELNSDIIRFISHVSEDGTLTIEKLQGTTKEDITVTKNEGEKHKVIVQVEDEAKARIKITKTEQGTETVIEGIRYKLIGEGLPSKGKILTTNENGEIKVNGLKINEEYTLEETKASGYYLANPIKFKIVNNEGTYELQITEGKVLENSVTEEDSLPIVNLKIENEKIPTYTLEISKIKKTLETQITTEETGENTTEEQGVTYLSGAKFKLYKRGEELGEYITDANGKITIENLYQYIEGKAEEGTYTLKEVLAPEGYAKVKDITFKVQNTDGTLNLINTNGKEEQYTVEGTTVKLTIEDSPSFKLIKKDAETGATLANVKFAIYNVDDGIEPAKNSKGEILGTLETINGEQYYTVTTDSNGTITADLPEGYYKAVEVEAPNKYDIKNSTYYFGIGGSREGKTEVYAEWGKAIGGSGNDIITSEAVTSDGGYIVVGSLVGVIDLGNGVTLTSNGEYDGMIIKYSKEGDIEWAKAIGGTSNDSINSVAESSDGGYIVGGYISSSIDLENGEKIVSKGAADGILIKYNSIGEVEWANTVGGTAGDQINSVAETSDGGYIVEGTFSGSLNLENGMILTSVNWMTDAMLIKYRNNGDIEWANTVGGTAGDQINSVAETKDRGYIVVASLVGAINLGNGVTLANNGGTDGWLIKYNTEGIVQWAKAVGGNSTDSISSVVETIDGGYVVGGYFSSSSVNLGNETILTNNGGQDGMLMKYSAEGNVEWAKAIGGSRNDSIGSVAVTIDGSYIAGGIFLSSSIDLGNGVTISNNSIYSDGMIIKYTSSGEVEWANAMGGTNQIYQNQINSVAETRDGGCIVGGFFSGSIDLGIGEKIVTKGVFDGILIKYNSIGEVEWAKSLGGVNKDHIESVAETRDGGYIVRGWFDGGTIDLGDGIKLTNNGGSDVIIVKCMPLEKPQVIVEQALGIQGDSIEEINCIQVTRDGGYIVGGSFRSSSLDLGNGIILNNNSGIHYGTIYYPDGMIIKYSSEGNAEWAKAIGGIYNEEIRSIVETTDGGYLVGGNFRSYSVDLGNGIILSTNGGDDGMFIKYNAKGEVEWAKSLRGKREDGIISISKTKDGGYLVGGYYTGSLNLENGVTLIGKGGQDGMLIKYNAQGEVEWVKSLGGISDDCIRTVAETSDGGYIVGGYFKSSSIALGNGVTLANSGSTSYSDGILIKYNEQGEAQWAKAIGGSSIDEIYSVQETSDGGYIVGGTFTGTIDLGNGVTIPGSGIIKYNSEGEAEWAKSMGKIYIYSVESTNDGGVIAVGEFSSTSPIDLGNGVTLSANGGADGMLVKYSEEGKAEWAKAIGGSNNDRVYSVAETIDGNYVVGGYFYSSSIDLGNGLTLNNQGVQNGMVVKISAKMGAPEVQELVVENARKEFRITTDINEIDGIKGGSISGEDRNPYEKVKYGDSNTKEIVMIPDENYEIIGITINGEEYVFTENEDGSYTMPIFTNVTEDKHIEVTYSLKDNKIIINKVDSETKLGLEGARFKLDQIEEREEPESEDIIGELTPNGKEYIEADIEKEVTGVLGELTNNGEYYFVEQEGKYVPTNSKTYQVANGGTAGIGNKTANSYMSIDLSDKEGTYVVVVNANVSSQSNDIGYVTIIENTEDNTTAPAYNASTGRFIYISGTREAQDYTSSVLEGGKKYYLHLGYYKNASTDTGNDQIEINSIKVYESVNVTYNFVENEGKYESTNEGKHSRTANSYLPIDLTNYKGKYNLIVNAKISSQSGDYGYVTVTESTDRPEYNSQEGRMIYITGTKEDTDYTTVLDGGKLYYLHLGYYKNDTTNQGEDKFTVNNINLTLSELSLYHTEVTTNSEGKAITQIPFGKYAVTETVAPEGYELNENAIVLEFREDENHEFTIENQKKARVIVHHYIKGTNTKLAEDELLEGKIGYEYTTSPKLDIEKYQLEKVADGSYIMPENAVGQYISGDQEVIYYYVEKEIPLVVNYYIEGTNTPVPLISGNNAQSTTTYGKEGAEYATEGISLEELSKEYELVSVPSNSVGTYNGNMVEVTYYYKKVARNVTINKYQEDGITALEGAKFTIANKSNSLEAQEYTTDSKGNIGVTLGVGDYIVTETEAPAGYQLPENSTQEITISRNIEEISLDVTNERQQGKVIVHHYIENTTEPVLLADGSKAQDQIKIGNVGEIYVTTAANIASKYELVTEPTISSGNITEEDTVVIYYYRLKDTSVVVHYYKEGTTESLSADVTVNGQVDDEYTTSATTDIPSKYELVAEPENAEGIMTEEQIVVTYYYRLKDTSVVVHYYKEGTEDSLSEDVTINGQVDDEYTTNAATDIPSKYELVAEPENKIGIMTEEQIVVTYYYRLKDTSVVVHYYKEGTTQSLSQDVTIEGQVDDEYTTSEALDIPSKYELVAEPTNKEGIMTEAQIVVTYYYRLKDTSVVVHYYKEGSTESLTQDVTINGQVDDEYITSAATDIPSKYELIATPENKEGIMTESQIVVIYYYRLKDTSVVVHYYKEGTTESLSKDITINGQIDDEYTTGSATDIPSKYELVATPENAQGLMIEEQIVVTYNYKLKGSSVIVHHYLEGTEDSLSADVTINGQVDDEYTTEVANDILEVYELVEEPENKTGIMTEEQIIVIYYYVLKTDVEYKVEWYYQVEGEYPETPNKSEIRKADALEEVKVTEEDMIPAEGYELYVHDTEKEILEGQVQGNGNFALKIYFKPQYKVTYKPGDQGIFEEETHEGIDYGEKLPEFKGKVGEAGKPKGKEGWEFKGWKTEEGEQAGETVTKDEVYVAEWKRKEIEYTVEYYYDGEKDESKTEILKGEYEEVIEEYKEKAGEKYTLIKTQGLPLTITIDASNNIIRVYYGTKAKAKVEYIDKDTGEILEEIEEEGYVGKEYETTAKDFETYILVEEPKEKTIIMTEEEQVLRYYYERITSGVIEKHIDIYTEEIIENVTHEGKVGDEYKTSEKEIEGYDFVKERYPENAEGIITEEIITVEYYYSRRAKVTVKYIDKETQEELVEEIIIEGHLGDEYETEEKEIEGYRIVKLEYPDNVKGEITKEEIEVIYYYERIPSGIITVEYVDKETEEIISKEEIKGLIGDEYKTEEKEIPYYMFINSTENTEGILTEEDYTVRYYYRKLRFNLSTNKTITQIILKGKETNFEGSKTAKVEIKEKELKEAELIIVYNIEITNTGEIEGKARVEELIPAGFELIEGMEEKTEIELQPGESKNITVKIRWLKGEENLGIKENTVKLVDIENAASYEEISTQDNSSSATVVVSIKTGETIKTIIKVLLTTSLIICLYMQVVLILDMNKGQGIKEIKFLNKKK